MAFKPFRPPLLRKPGNEQNLPIIVTSNAEPTTTLPPQKKRRLSPSEEGPDRKTKQLELKSQSRQRPMPFLPVGRDSNNPSSSNGVPENAQGIASRSGQDSTFYYNVLWRKFTNKKHKTWDGDGVLCIRGGFAYLQDLSGRDMGKIAYDAAPPEPGTTLSIASKEVEIESTLSKQDYLAGRPFLAVSKKPAPVREVESAKKVVNLNPGNVKVQTLANDKGFKDNSTRLPKTKATQSQFKNPLLEKTVLEKGALDTPVPRHDPEAHGALVMKRPVITTKGKQLVDVVLDPILSRNLRQHQREGVKFLYECVMGMRPHNGEGAILADEMGLGKTLQVIALLWTLLKQNPIFNDPPVVKKALIVCPVTLIKNWKKEFRKWLGNERVGVFILDGNKSRLTDFTMGRSYSVMIVGYEKLRTIQDDLQKGSGIDIVIADEGHRLKTAQNKSAQAIKSLNTQKRIILSGTPLQNDLNEFYFMVDFVNPGLLGKQGAFKRQFENPILKSHQPGASAKDIEKGEERSEELASLTSQFILRRTLDILAQYLPPKTEYVLFCRPTSTQAAVYRSILQSSSFGSILGSPEASLQLIDIFKKLCNSPTLLRSKEDVEESKGSLISSLLAEIHPSLLKSPGASGKLQILDSLLHSIRKNTLEKVVIVSHYTSTLDIISRLLDSLSYSWLRLDGSTPSAKRQELVDRFNRSEASKYFAFLLSAKSGGVGLNLTGASRLILFDVDWNPSADLQAMARIHRDGQKRPCRIYRLLTQGTLDEKIYQRQLAKLSLADSVIDNKESSAGFSRDELKDLFLFDETDKCNTHELSRCQCGGSSTAHAAISGAESPIINLDELDGNHDLDSDDAEAGSKTKYPMPIKASQLNIEALERDLNAQMDSRTRKAEKAKIMALMQYCHLDPSTFPSLHDSGPSTMETSETDPHQEELEMTVDDEVLVNVLKERESRIGYIFCKSFSTATMAAASRNTELDAESIGREPTHV